MPITLLLQQHSITRQQQTDLLLNNVIVSDFADSNCPEGSADPQCRVSIAKTPVVVVASDLPSAGDDLPGCTTVEFDDPKYTVVKSSDSAPGKTVLPDGTVAYMLSVTNNGRVPVTATISDDLTGVLDDAVYNNDATADIGTVTFASPKLDWTGTIPIGGKATIKYTTTVTAAGDLSIHNVVRGLTPSGNALSTCLARAHRYLRH